MISAVLAVADLMPPPEAEMHAPSSEHAHSHDGQHGHEHEHGLHINHRHLSVHVPKSAKVAITCYVSLLQDVFSRVMTSLYFISHACNVYKTCL